MHARRRRACGVPSPEVLSTSGESESPSLFGLGLEAIPDAVTRLDERVPRRARVDLLAQPAHEDVDGPIAVALPAAPELLQQLVASHDPAAVERELVEEPELRRRQLAALAVDERLHFARVHDQLLDLDRLAARRRR